MPVCVLWMLHWFLFQSLASSHAPVIPWYADVSEKQREQKTKQAKINTKINKQTNKDKQTNKIYRWVDVN